MYGDEVSVPTSFCYGYTHSAFIAYRYGLGFWKTCKYPAYQSDMPHEHLSVHGIAVELVIFIKSQKL